MQGFNMGRYVPPDVEGTLSGNALHKKHPLGARASKLRSSGVLTVRFEMPFAIWCATCPKPTLIAQGVRFNAEKKKIGAYYSTPIWSFCMRHAACGGSIEIRTDPGNAAYVVHSGGRKRDTGDEAHREDSLVPSGEIVTQQEHNTLRTDAFARLEKTIEDRHVLIERSHRISELEDASQRAWEDPYTQNRRLRSAFRAGRKMREVETSSTEALTERMGLGIELLPATEADARRAALVDFGVAAALGDREKDIALAKPLFDSKKADPGTEKGGKKRLKSDLKASRTRESLASEIRCNTRVSQDPFLQSRSGGGDKVGSRIQGIKRRRLDETETDESEKSMSGDLQTGTSTPGDLQTGTSTPALLVEYDSD